MCHTYLPTCRNYSTVAAVFLVAVITTCSSSLVAIGADRTIVLEGKDLFRFSLASCNDYQPKEPTHSHNSIDGTAATTKFDWDLVANRKPDALIWGGDIIYGDFPRNQTYLPAPLSYFFPGIPLTITPFVPTPWEKLTRMYSSLKNDEGYSSLLKQIDGRHLGTWDDHDYGLNDGDRLMPLKQDSKDAFLTFFGALPDDPRRKRGGVYSSTLFTNGESSSGGGGGVGSGPTGGPTGGRHSVLVLALDMRWFKDPYDAEKEGGGGGGGGGGDFLGEEQWAWLEATLLGSNADAHIFVSSLQLLVVGREPFSECWNDFPEARERFLQLLVRLNVKAPLVVSGDVHFAEVMEADCGGGTAGGAKVVELTTSGLTHSWSPNGMGMVQNDLSADLHVLMNAVEWFYPWRFQTRSPPLPLPSNKNNGLGGGGGNFYDSSFWVGGHNLKWWPSLFTRDRRDFFLSENFGEFEFDWESDPANPSVHVRVLDAHTGALVIEKAWPLASFEQAAKSTQTDHETKCLGVEGGTTDGNTDHTCPADVGKRRATCVPHRGEPSLLRLAAGMAAVLLAGLLLFAVKPAAFLFVLWRLFVLYRRQKSRRARNM